MKLPRIALAAALSVMSYVTSAPAVRATQLDEVLKRLEALEKENTSLRDRLRRLEARRTPEQKTSAGAAKTTQAAAASPMAAYNAFKAPPALPIPAFNWSGFYVGGHVGGGFQARRLDDPFTVSAFLASASGVPIRTIHPDGFLGGVQAGWNYQLANLLIGIEANASWADLKGSRSDTISATAIEPGFFPTEIFSRM